MKLLLSAATSAEIAPLLDHFKLEDSGFVQGPGFDVLITGVGMTATAFALGRTLKGGYDLLLNAGIAGSFNRDLAAGSLVCVTRDTFSEFGAEDHADFLTAEDLGLGRISFEAEALEGLRAVSGITVNTVHGNEQSIAALRSRITADVESMEGAANLFCAHMSGIRSAQVRCISNYVEARNREAWQIGPAIAKLNDWLINFITTSK